MSYNLEAFIHYLGNDLDGTQRTNCMYFLNGRQRAVGITKPEDIDAAERFIKLNDGKHNLYVNLNTCGPRVSGKPKDSEIIATRNLLIDIDSIKAPGHTKHPATEAELNQIPILDISMTAADKLVTLPQIDFTGNGFRLIIPVKDATNDDQRNFVHYLCTKFPGYIDTNVVDPSRITGVPGTMNVKTETDDRVNRRRRYFPGYTRQPIVPPTYTMDEMAAISAASTTHRSKTTTSGSRPAQRIPIDPHLIGATVQEILNKYILKCATQAPYILKLIEFGPTEGNGFNYDGFFAAEIYNKVGDAPRVYATIMKSVWGPDYNARATQKAWEDVVGSGVGAWSVNTIRQKFGNEIFEVK